MTKKRVSFKTSNLALQKLFDSAEKSALVNIADFGGRKVMTEGTVLYPNVWLETQPMSGEMYGKRDLEIAINNNEIFIDTQREDGRLAGMISVTPDGLKSHYGWLQGCYLAMPAFKVYYLAGKDKKYLEKLYNCLEKFDHYLWKYRDSDNNGCLESWCIWDTGEDECTRLGNAPNFFEGEKAPEGYDVVPMESMDFMGFSYANRDVLARISIILNNGKEVFWRGEAEKIRKKIKEYLWIDEKSACFDRDSKNNVMDILIHNNLRVMYFGAFSQEMADSFIKKHILNSDEFWTPMPLPSIAVSDKYFRNTDFNNWSGQPQALTYQRTIEAFTNYGHFAELTLLGEKYLEVNAKSCKFTQQINPFTCEQSLAENDDFTAYGPAIVTTLEFIARLYGIHIEFGSIFWSAVGSGQEYFEYVQHWAGNDYILINDKGVVRAYINKRLLFAFSENAKIITDANGNIQRIIGISPEPQICEIVRDGIVIKFPILPNEQFQLKNNRPVLEKAVEFALISK